MPAHPLELPFLAVSKLANARHDTRSVHMVWAIEMDRLRTMGPDASREPILKVAANDWPGIA